MKSGKAQQEVIKGIRVDDDTVIIKVKGGNDAARWLCGELFAMLSSAHDAPQRDTPNSELDGKLKREFVAKQFREAMYQEWKKVQEVTFRCGLKMPLRFAFKCLYCGEFYCQSCAEDHFGKTRAQWIADKAANAEVG